METRESQREKRVQDVLKGTKTGGGGSPSAAVMRAREELQGIDAERAQNLEQQKSFMTGKQQQMATMKQAAMIGAAGMMGGGAAVAAPSPVAAQVATMNPQTQALLGKYGIKPGQTSKSDRNVKTNTQQQTAGPNIRTTTNNTTNNNTRTEIRIVQPQIPMRQQSIPVAQSAGGAAGLNKFKAWLDSSFAKQENQYEIQKKEFRKREWNLARSSNKLYQKLTESTASLGQKLDPKNMGSSVFGQFKHLLFIFLASTAKLWWDPLMKKVAEFEACVRSIFGLPISGELREGGAGGIEFSNKIKTFILGEKSDKSKSLLAGIKDVFSSGIQRIIDKMDLMLEDRKMALSRIQMPDFQLPDLSDRGTGWFGDMANAFGSSLKGIMAPAMGYLGDILGALIGGSKGLARTAARNVNTVSKKSFMHQFGGQYFNSGSTDMFGNLKQDSTYGMSKLMMGNLNDRSTTLHTGGIMTGLKMLNDTAQKDGAVTIAPQLLSELGIDPSFLKSLIASGKASYVPMKVIQEKKTSAENKDYAGGSALGYMAEGAWDAINPFNLTGGIGASATQVAAYKSSKAAKAAVNGGKGLKAAMAGLKAGGRTFLRGSGWGTAALGLVGAGKGMYDYGQANAGNSGYVTRAVPMSDPRPGNPVTMLKMTKEGFDELKSHKKIESFDSSDRALRDWIESIERSKKASHGVRGKLTYENANQMNTLDESMTRYDVFKSKKDAIDHRNDAYGAFTDNVSDKINSARTWAASKLDLMASKVSNNPSIARQVTIRNLYTALKAALDKKRPDLPEDKREAFARLMAAQAMHESAGSYEGGVSRLAYEGNNYGGVIATAGRDTITLNGKKWTKFKDMNDWAEFQVSQMNGDDGFRVKYKMFDQDPTNYVNVLKEHGYFGDESSESYSGKVQSWLGSVNSTLGAASYTSFDANAGGMNFNSESTGKPWAVDLGADLSGASLSNEGVTIDKNLHPRLQAVLKSRNTGKYFSTKLGTQDLGKNDYQGQCTAGPSTWYGDAGYNIRRSWWASSPGKATRCELGSKGFRKTWNGNIGDIDNLGQDKLRPGDIGILFGMHADGEPSAHGMMWDGKSWVSDTVQSHGDCYNGRGRLGNQSSQLWRFPEFWEDMGSGDTGEGIGTEHTYINQDGETFTSTAAREGVAEALGKAANYIAPSSSTLGREGAFDKSRLSRSQRATYDWMISQGAKEDKEHGLLYLEDKKLGYRVNLDYNTGISKSGVLENSNIGTVSYISRKTGAITGYVQDDAESNMIKDRLLGENLRVKLNTAKDPGSDELNIALGDFDDIQGFSKRAQKYYEDYENGRIHIFLGDIAKDGSEITSILTKKIPLIDQDGDPMKEKPGWGASWMYYDQDVDKYVDISKKLTYLKKKKGFRVCIHGQWIDHDLNPYMNGELKITVTPKAQRMINTLLEFYRGVEQSEEDTILAHRILAGKSGNPGAWDKTDAGKSAAAHRAKVAEFGKNGKLEAAGLIAEKNEKGEVVKTSEEKYNEMVSKYQKGENRNDFKVIKSGESGKYDVINIKTGLKIGSTEDSSGKLGTSDVIKFGDQDFSSGSDSLYRNLQRLDASEGHLNVNADTEFIRMSDIYGRSLEGDNGNLRKILTRKLRETEPTQVKDKLGNTFLRTVDENGHFKYKIGENLLTKLGNPESRSDEEEKIYRALMSEKDKDGNVIKGTSFSEKRLNQIAHEGLSASEMKQLMGPDWDGRLNLFSDKGFLDSTEGILKGRKLLESAKREAAFMDDWDSGNSRTKQFFQAIVDKYNDDSEKNAEKNAEELEKMGVTEDHGMLYAKDGADRTMVVGRVGKNGKAEMFENSKDAAEYNEMLHGHNSKSELSKHAIEAWYTTKYGAKSLGDGRMWIGDDNNRIVFSVSEVGENATLDEIEKAKSTKIYYKDQKNSDTSDGDYSEGFEEFHEGGWKTESWGEKVLYGKNKDGSSRIVGTERVNDTARAVEKLVKERKTTEEQDQENFRQGFNKSLADQANLNSNIIDKSSNQGEITNAHLDNLETIEANSRDYLKLLVDYTMRDEKNSDWVERKSELAQKSEIIKSVSEKKAEKGAEQYTINHSKKRIDEVYAGKLRELAEGGADYTQGTLKSALEATAQELGLTFEEVKALGRHNEKGGTWVKGIMAKYKGPKVDPKTKAKAGKPKSKNTPAIVEAVNANSNAAVVTAEATSTMAAVTAKASEEQTLAMVEFKKLIEKEGNILKDIGIGEKSNDISQVVQQGAPVIITSNVYTTGINSKTSTATL